MTERVRDFEISLRVRILPRRPSQDEEAQLMRVLRESAAEAGVEPELPGGARRHGEGREDAEEEEEDYDSEEDEEGY